MRKDGNRERSHSSNRITDVLNRSCHCINVDRSALQQTLETRLGESGAHSRLLESHPHLLADSPVFVSQDHAGQMSKIIKSIESVVSLKSYRDRVSEWVPELGRSGHGPRGVFFGYDFHLTNSGPKLIEINTNAGGALLLLHVASAQQACCREVENFLVGGVNLATLEQDLVAMFRKELHLQFPGRPLRQVAIVDEDPTGQFLSPEFFLFREMFEHHGIDAAIVGPKRLALRRGELLVDGRVVDLVYNRLTDFYLQSPKCSVLRRAYRDNITAVTPAPYTHALYGNKQNLTVFSDRDLLADMGVNPEAMRILASGVPHTVMVSEENADSLWADRRQLFFKPLWGYGSKGTYRGSKLTRRTWQAIRDGSYIAQELVPPSERLLVVDGDHRSLKLDVRCYVYDGEIQLLGARMYRGQTTNFRTDGGGLAAVFMAP